MTRDHAGFFGITALLFAVSAGVTIAWCGRMSEMGMMPMPGGWAMTWMPGQDWPGAALSFLAMWLVMMIAMMLPSLVPTLWRYRATLGGRHRDRLTVIAGAAYFCVWAALGAIIFPAGIMLAAAELRWPALSQVMPLAAGVIVTLAGVAQFTGWKARALACCQVVPARSSSPDIAAAARYGLQHGVRCVVCCAGLTAVLLAMGMMDLRAMALVTAAITAERLAGKGVAQAIGAVVIGAGLYLVARALAG